MDSTYRARAKNMESAEWMGSKEKLEEMVLRLDQMDPVLHSKNLPPPTVAELGLYGLILWHVNSYIKLFRVEECTKESLRMITEMVEAETKGENLLPWMVDEDSVFDHTDDVSAGEVYEDLFDVWSLANIVKDLLKTRRFSFSTRLAMDAVKLIDVMDADGTEEEELQCLCSASEVRKRKKLKVHTDVVRIMPEAADCGAQIPVEDEQVESEGKNRKTREQYLLNILRGLEDMGRLRLYAPPAHGEIHYYRQIRKRITSSLGYYGAKVDLQNYLGEEECKHQSNADSSGKEKWISIRCLSLQGSIADTPVGHRIASALDELPQFLSLLKGCKDRSLDTSLISYEENGERELTVCDVGWRDDYELRGIEVKGEIKGATTGEMEKRKQEAHVADAPVMPFRYGKAAEKNPAAKKGKKPRKQCLQDIIRIFEKMGSCLYANTTVEEARLLARVEEHVKSSIWMFDSCVKSQEETKQGEPAKGKEKYDFIEGDSDGDAYGLSDDNVRKTETKTREQHLQEIVFSVEAIKSSYLYTPPTAGERTLYNKMRRLIGEKFSKSKGLDRYTNPLTGASVKRILWALYTWERKCFKEAAEEWGTMAKMMIPEIPEDVDAADALNWVAKNEEFLFSQMSECESTTLLVHELPQQIKMLDWWLLILGEVDCMAEYIYLNLAHASLLIDLFMSEAAYPEVVEEVCHGIQVLKWAEAAEESA